MSFDPKVVPFDRGADFVYQRAMKNRRDNNMIDALELMRKAVEASPDNDAYKMDLAELLCDTGCPIQSNQVLLDMLSQGKNESQCLYTLAVNQLNMNNTEGAKKLLRICVDRERAGELHDQAWELFGEIGMYEAMNRPVSRKLERILDISDAACDKLREDDFSGARRLFERVLSMDANQRDVRALLGMTHMLMGNKEEAVSESKSAIMAPGETLRALCVSGQVFSMAGENAMARAALTRALDMDRDGLDQRMLVYSLVELNMLNEARDEARMALRDAPCDRLLLHAMAIIELKLGADTKEAVKYWQRITRIDPEDSIAAYYFKAAEDGSLDISGINCEYQVPRRELVARYKYVAEKLEGDFEKLSEQWRENAKFRSLIAWCLVSENRRFHEAAVTLLSSIDDPRAESQMREYLLRGDTGFDMTMRAAAMYRMRGQDINRILPPYINGGQGLVPDGDNILDGMTVGHRQLVRLASDIVESAYGMNAYDHLAVMWNIYRKNRPLRTDPLIKTEAAAGALAYCYLMLAGKEPDLSKLSKQFDCAERQLMYFARHMAAILESHGGISGDEEQ